MAHDQISGHSSTEEALGQQEKNGARVAEDEYANTHRDAESNRERPEGFIESLTFKRSMAFLGMGLLWTGSQLPGYLWGGIPPIIYTAIGGADRWVWFVTAYLLASAAVCPFVGAFTDLVGRRYAALSGCLFLIVGQIVCSVAKDMNTFICGMTLTGVGAGIDELVALAGTAEIAPTAQRGKYIAVLIFAILPFTPSVMWAQLIAANHGWRYVGVVTTVYVFVGFVLVALFYHPPPRTNSLGMRWKEIVPQIDFVGGLLSIAGVVLLIAGVLWGGYMYPWKSVHVLVPLLLGAALVVAFFVWEVFTKYPMVPRRIASKNGHRSRTFYLSMVVTFVSGANFFAVLLLWPSQAYNVYGHDPVGVGLRGLPFGLAVLVGCCVTLLLLSRFRGGNRWLLFGASVIMTAGCGMMTAARRDNLSLVYGALVVAGLGVGGIVVPASIVAQVVCPDDLIATATALTMAVRVIGGAIGYAIYYNVLVQKAEPRLISHIAAAFQTSLKDAQITLPGLWGMNLLEKIVLLTASAQPQLIKELPYIGNSTIVYDAVLLAGQEAYAESYPYVYYASLAFGGLSIIASLMMEDIGKFMDDTVAVTLG